MQVARDGEEPGAQTCVGVQPVRMLHQSKPCLFEQVFSDIMATRQSQQKREQTEIEGVVDGIERRFITAAQSLDERRLGLRVHGIHNARQATA